MFMRVIAMIGLELLVVPIKYEYDWYVGWC